MALRTSVLAAVLVLSGLAVPATAAAQTPQRIAAALRADPVFADPQARPTLNAAEAGRVRLEILERELGRIKIAVVRPATAAAAGGVKGLADAIDAQLRTPGTLLVVAGDNAWLTTSYPDPQRAVAAVRRAFAGPGSLADALVRAVRGIARVDPGRGGDLERTQPVVSPEIDDAAEDFLGTIKLIFWVVGVLIALPFAIGGFLIVRAVVRGARSSRQAVADHREDAREQLVGLGEEIRALDTQGGVFDDDPAGQAAYERALGAYERADRLLAQADSPRRVNRVRAALAEGRKHIADARARIGVPAPPPTVAGPAPRETAHYALREEANRAFGRED